MGRLRLSTAQPIPSGHAYNPNKVCNASAPRSRTLRSGPALSAENAQSINHSIYTTTIYCICQSVKKHILCSVSSKGEGFHCRHKPTKELKRSIPFFPNESSHGSLLTFDQNVFYVKFYFPIKFINICAVCARVANPCGSRIPPPLPLIMPFSMAQRRASAA